METLTLILFKERNIFQDKAKKQCWQIPSTANLTKTRAGWQEALAHSIQMALLQGQEQVLGWALCFAYGSAPFSPSKLVHAEKGTLFIFQI